MDLPQVYPPAVPAYSILDYTVDIIDQMGQVFDTITSSGTSEPTMVDMDSIPDGIYYLFVMSYDRSSIFIERLIKAQ